MSFRRLVIFSILIVFTLTPLAYGQDFDFYLINISKDKKTAVIGQKGSDVKWKVQKGDKIENWNVIEITKRHVRLKSDPNEVTNNTISIVLTRPAIRTMPSVPHTNKK